MELFDIEIDENENHVINSGEIKIFEFYEFNTLEDAQSALAQVNSYTGLPIEGNVTQTWCNVEFINNKYAIIKDHLTSVVLNGTPFFQVDILLEVEV